MVLAKKHVILKAWMEEALTQTHTQSLWQPGLSARKSQACPDDCCLYNIGISQHPLVFPAQSFQCTGGQRTLKEDF